MLNLPIDLAVAEAPLRPGLPAELLPPVSAMAPPVPEFAGLMDLQLPAAVPAVPVADPALLAEELPPDSPVIEQAWALVLVPELGNLPAQILLPPPPAITPTPVVTDETGAAADDPAGLTISPWPQRAAISARPRLAGLLPADPVRQRGWQAGLPAAPALPAAPITAVALPPAGPDPVQHNIAGQPIAQPAAALPPLPDPQLSRPPFDLANPVLAWTDPTRPPTQAVAAPIAAAPVLPAAFTSPIAAPQLHPAHAGKPLPTVDLAASPETTLTPDRAEAPSAPPAMLPAPTLIAAPAASAPPPALAPASTPAAPPALAADPALAIASDRLGDVAIRLSGGPDQLQVTMQAQPAAAALIGAEAPRLSQDLAAAGIALAGLNINGQRADLSGGQRDRQRQPGRRGDDAAPLAGVRRLTARSAAQAASPNPNIDRFA